MSPPFVNTATVTFTTMGAGNLSVNIPGNEITGIIFWELAYV